MDEFELKKQELLRPLFFEAGAALHDCQHFEYGLALLLFHFSRLGAPGLDPTAIQRILDNKDKKTAGQLIHMLKKHVTVSPGIETALADGLDARNIIVHRILADNVEMIPKADTRAALVKQIRQQRRKVRQADKMLKPFIVAFSEALDGVEQAKMELEVRALFSWQ
jgi:hypothetical protein